MSEAETLRSSISSAVQPTGNRYLDGVNAPLSSEVTAFDLPVTGAIPTELEGRWLRNGPNPIAVADPARHHWFTGEGMVHGLRLRDGKAEWYRNRWVRPETGFGPNTSVGGFAGKTLAMVEGGPFPVEMTYELETIGRTDFGGRLQSAFSAHPKYDPSTGELHAMTYCWPDLVDHLQYVVVDSEGVVTRTVDIPVEDMPMVHDISITPNWVVVYDLPVTVSLDLAMKGYELPVAWNDEHPARLGLLPRTAVDASEIIWCPIDPCYIFHPVNAFETATGDVVVDVCRYDRLFQNDILGPFSVDSPPTLDRFTLDPLKATVKSERIDDRPHEFPRHDPRLATSDYRFAYTSLLDYQSPILHGAIAKTDLRSGISVEHDFGLGRGGAEPIFVPRRDSRAEDDGWILCLVHDGVQNPSELHIIDAYDFTGRPTAVITLPQRVPLGFHGNWVSDSSVVPPG